MSIIVFSKNFASSKPCLYEVEMILDHSKKSEHAILPVFYDVDPFEVKKKAKGLASAEGLGRHETQERQKEWKDKAEGWSIALKEVANMAGMVLQNEADGEGA
ncbi:unnamed protein product [Ilex paraguariensis]|uniref:TIR domain-containing protein n=1 Tax=Ilex paraguariensis TaxID=185542 RepID=A0ABC8TFJ0_9AQUA